VPGTDAESAPGCGDGYGAGGALRPAGRGAEPPKLVEGFEVTKAMTTTAVRAAVNRPTKSHHAFDLHTGIHPAVHSGTDVRFETGDAFGETPEDRGDSPPVPPTSSSSALRGTPRSLR
jgi:hypothetical protein